MMTPSEEADCVGWYFGTISTITVQRMFRGKYKKNPPSEKSILDWHWKFLADGNTLDRQISGPLSTSAANVAHIRQAFISSPIASTRNALRQLYSVYNRASSSA